MAGNTKTSFL